MLAGVDPQSAQGGRGRHSSLCLRWSASGRALWHQEGGRSVGGMDPQKHSVGCLHGASKFSDGNWFPLGFRLGDERGRWHFPAPLFPRAELCLTGLNNSPSRCPLVLPLSESRPVDFQHSRCQVLLAVRTQGVGTLCFFKELCLAQWAAPPPPRLPPASPCSAHGISALPTLLNGPLVYPWLQRVRSASLLAVF